MMLEIARWLDSSPPKVARRRSLGGLLAALVALPLLAFSQGQSGDGSGSTMMPCGNIVTGPNCISYMLNESATQGGFATQQAAQQWAMNLLNIANLAVEIFDDELLCYYCDQCSSGTACGKSYDYFGNVSITISQNGSTWEVTVTTLNGLFQVCCKACGGIPI